MEDLQTRIEQLEVENKRLKKSTIKASEKGCISLSIGSTFPASFYKDQWLTILERADDIRDFIEENDETLPTKAESAVRNKKT